MNREDFWKFTYRLRRYLAGSTDEELIARFRDIALNSFTFTSAGQVGMHPQASVHEMWAEQLVHLATECATRDRDPLDGFDLKDFVFTKGNLEAFRKQQHVLAFRPTGPIFCRYGRLEHMTALRERGEVLLRPASCYSAGSLDSARRDDELVLRTYVCPHDYDLGLVDRRLRKHHPERCFIHLDHEKPTDFFMLCLTAGFEIRLFADFGANACLVIHDQGEFERRLTAGFREALPGWGLHFAQARYVDPYHMPMVLDDDGADLAFWKHFRYMYQKEWRMVALPPPGEGSPLEKQHLQLGSLSDISEVIALDGDPFGTPGSPQCAA